VTLLACFVIVARSQFAPADGPLPIRLGQFAPADRPHLPTAALVRQVLNSPVLLAQERKPRRSYCPMTLLTTAERPNRMSITDFRKSPGKFLRQSTKSGLILYSHNRLIGYFLGAHSYDRLVAENRRQQRLLSDLLDSLTSTSQDLTKLVEHNPALRQAIQDHLLYNKRQRTSPAHPSKINLWLEALQNATS